MLESRVSSFNLFIVKVALTQGDQIGQIVWLFNSGTSLEITEVAKKFWTLLTIVKVMY
jgi:hypothetical protein